jgi:hypothetical protein
VIPARNERFIENYLSSLAGLAFVDVIFPAINQRAINNRP